MQQITNPYLDFGKEMIARHSGIGYYYDSLSLLHPEYEEEGEKAPEHHSYITNITQLQILKEYNELFQNNLTFLTKVMSKKVVEKIYPSFEIRIEKKISELLPQVEKEVSNLVTEKYLSLRSDKEEQNLALLKQILQERQVTSQLSEKQMLQTVRNIENYTNSLSHYEDVYTRQIRQAVEHKLIQLADIKTTDTVEKLAKTQKRQKDNFVGSRIAQIVHQQIEQKQQQEKPQWETWKQEWQQEKQQQERQKQEWQQEKQQQEQQKQEWRQQQEQQKQEWQQEKQQQERQKQEWQQEKQQQQKNPAEIHNVYNASNRLIKTISQLNQLENIAVHNPVKEIVNRSDYESSDLVYHESEKQNTAQEIQPTKEIIRHEVSQAADRLLQQEKKQQERWQKKQQEGQQKQQTKQQTKQQIIQQTIQQTIQQERQLGKPPVRQPERFFEVPSALPDVNSRLNYEKSNLIYHEASKAENPSVTTSLHSTVDQSGYKGSKTIQNQISQHRISQHQTAQSFDPGKKQEHKIINNRIEQIYSQHNKHNEYHDHRKQIQQHNRFINNRTLQIAQTIHQLNRLESSLIYNSPVQKDFLQITNEAVDNRSYKTVSQFSPKKVGDLIYNQTIQAADQNSLQNNPTVNQTIHHHSTKLVNQRMYTNNDIKGTDSVHYMEMPVELVYEARPDNQRNDEPDKAAGEQTRIQEKTVQNVVKDIEFVKETKKIVKDQVHETILQREPGKETEVIFESYGKDNSRVMEQLQKTIDKRVDESVGQIADRVYRNLEERLRSERNRRGY